MARHDVEPWHHGIAAHIRRDNSKAGTLVQNMAAGILAVIAVFVIVLNWDNPRRESFRSGAAIEQSEAR